MLKSNFEFITGTIDNESYQKYIEGLIVTKISLKVEEIDNDKNDLIFCYIIKKKLKEEILKVLNLIKLKLIILFSSLKTIQVKIRFLSLKK